MSAESDLARAVARALLDYADRVDAAGDRVPGVGVAEALAADAAG